MAKQSRREFLAHSMLSAATAASSWSVAAGPTWAEEANASGSTSPSEKLGVALLGTGMPNGRGTRSHLPFFSGRPDTEILWIVDPDEKNGLAAVELAAKNQGRAPSSPATCERRSRIEASTSFRSPRPITGIRWPRFGRCRPEKTSMSRSQSATT